MKRLVILTVIAAAAAVSGLNPFRSTDVAQLLPVQALTVDVYVSGWHAFEENTHRCQSQAEMETSVAAIDLAPAAVYYDE